MLDIFYPACAVDDLIAEAQTWYEGEIDAVELVDPAEAEITSTDNTFADREEEDTSVFSDSSQGLGTLLEMSPQQELEESTVISSDSEDINSATFSRDFSIDLYASVPSECIEEAFP